MKYHPPDIPTPILDLRADQIEAVLREAWPEPMRRSQIAIAADIPRGTVDHVLACSCLRHGARFEFIGVTEETWHGIPAKLYRIRESGDIAVDLTVLVMETPANHNPRAPRAPRSTT